MYLRKCDKKGFPKTKNISPDLEKGIEEIKEKRRRKETMTTVTDKSKQLASNTMEYYLEGMRPHLGEDEVVSWQEQCKLENIIKGHTLQLARTLRVGSKWDTGGKHWERVKNAIRTKYCLAPPFLVVTTRITSPWSLESNTWDRS